LINKIIIDGKYIKSKRDLYPPFRSRYNDLFGSNLNALHDVLSYNRYNDYVLYIYNASLLEQTLGSSYYNEFLDILKNDKVNFVIK